MNLRFNEPWIEDVFVSGFDKPVELHRGLPRTDLGFYEPCMCSMCVVLLHTCLSRSGVYWHYSFVLFRTCYSQSGTYWRHGALAYMTLIK